MLHIFNSHSKFTKVNFVMSEEFVEDDVQVFLSNTSFVAELLEDLPFIALKYGWSKAYSAQPVFLFIIHEDNIQVFAVANSHFCQPFQENKISKIKLAKNKIHKSSKVTILTKFLILINVNDSKHKTHFQKF